MHCGTIQRWARAGASAMVVALAAGAAQAGIVVGSGGNVGFGGTSQWEAVGLSSSSTGDNQWSYGGNATASRVVDIQGGDGRVSLENVVGTQTQGGPLTLSAAATISAYIPGTGRVTGRGWSSAVVNDIVYVQPTGSSFSTGFIGLQWKVDGTLLFDIQSNSGQWLNAAVGVEWAHMARAETYISWKDPLTGSVSTSKTDSLGQIEVTKAGSTFTQDQLNAMEILRIAGSDPQTQKGGGFFADGVTSWEQRTDVDQPGGFSDLIEAPWGMPVEVMLGLAAYYNVLWDLDDFGMLDSGVYSQFEHTAELVAVRLYNSDGTPYIGQWTLVSANGIDYPEVILDGPPGATVPEPGTLALLLVGLLGFSQRRIARTAPGRR